MKAPSWLSYIAAILALMGLLWTAASQWQSLNDRVTNLENKTLYMFGKLTIPKT
jgi:hypothetical protein